MSWELPKIERNLLEFMRLCFGYLLLIGVMLLARGIGLNQVTEQSSFGLREIILILGMLASNWSSWAFFSNRQSKEEVQKELEPK
jgi:hypothetical protein